MLQSGRLREAKPTTDEVPLYLAGTATDAVEHREQQPLAEVPVKRGFGFARHELTSGAEDLHADGPELERELRVEQLGGAMLEWMSACPASGVGRCGNTAHPDLDLFDEPSERESVDGVPERVVVRPLAGATPVDELVEVALALRGARDV